MSEQGTGYPTGSHGEAEMFEYVAPLPRLCGGWLQWEKWRLKIQIGSMHEGLCSKYECKRTGGRHTASSTLEYSERWLGHPRAGYGIRRRRTAANELRGRGRRRRLWRRLRAQGSLNLTMQALACALVRRHDPRPHQFILKAADPRESKVGISCSPAAWYLNLEPWQRQLERDIRRVFKSSSPKLL